MAIVNLDTCANVERGTGRVHDNNNGGGGGGGGDVPMKNLNTYRLIRRVCWLPMMISPRTPYESPQFNGRTRKDERQHTVAARVVQSATRMVATQVSILNQTRTSTRNYSQLKHAIANAKANTY